MQLVSPQDYIPDLTHRGSHSCECHLPSTKCHVGAALLLIIFQCAERALFVSRCQQDARSQCYRSTPSPGTWCCRAEPPPACLPPCSQTSTWSGWCWATWLPLQRRPCTLSRTCPPAPLMMAALLELTPAMDLTLISSQVRGCLDRSFVCCAVCTA